MSDKETETKETEKDTKETKIEKEEINIQEENEGSEEQEKTKSKEKPDDSSAKDTAAEETADSDAEDDDDPENENIDELLDSISKQSGKTVEELKGLVKEKQDEFGGLLTKEAAAHTIGRELGAKMKVTTSTQEKIGEKFTIGDLEDGLENVTLTAKINAVFPTYHFEKTNAKGRVTNVELIDGTGKIRVVLWNDEGKPVEEGLLNKGDCVTLHSVQVAKNREFLELRMGYSGTMEKCEESSECENLPEIKVKILKVKELKAGENDVDVVAKIGAIYGIRKFTSDRGEGKVANVLIADGEDTSRLVLWNNATRALKNLNRGDTIKIENAYTKDGMNGVEVHAGWRTRIIANPQGVEEPKPLVARNKKISELEDRDFNVKVEGILVDLQEQKGFFYSCPTCKKGLRDGECKEHGNVEGVPELVSTGTLDDGTGTIQVVFYRKNAEALLGTTAQEAVNKIEETGDEFAPINDAKESVVGKEFVIEGNVKFNEMRGEKELIVNFFTKNDGNPGKTTEEKTETKTEEKPKKTDALEEIERELEEETEK
ncbi:MAG: hypothetical protein J7K00_03895 [Candidatus Diapherotrites archaeon]|nr:hypothetical protein [Candidatus Diapherotrites archaeon]